MQQLLSPAPAPEEMSGRRPLQLLLSGLLRLYSLSACSLVFIEPSAAGDMHGGGRLFYEGVDLALAEMRMRVKVLHQNQL